MKKILIATSLVLVICLSVCLFVACDNSKNKTTASEMESNHYTVGYSVASAAAMLDTGYSASAAAMAEGTPSASLTGEFSIDSDNEMFQTIAQQLTVVENFLDRASVKVEEAVSDIPEYAYKMNITSVSALTGEEASYSLYYNLTAEVEDDDDDDDDKWEIDNEQEFVIEGIMNSGDKQFELVGEMEVETELNENEQSFSFVATEPVTGCKVKFEQEFGVENGEIEEELNYEFWIANRKIYSFSIEFEHENGKEELEVSTSFGSGLLDEWLGTTIRYDRESENGRNIINAHIRQGKLEAGVQIWAVENAEEGKHVFGYRITDETAWNQIFDDLFGTEEPAPAQ